MLKNFLLISFASLLVFSCSSVPDVPVCVELDVNRGWCTNTISDVEYYVEDNSENPLKKSWWELTPTMVHVPYQSWAKIKSYIQKECKRNDSCRGVGDWENRSKKLDNQIGK